MWICPNCNSEVDESIQTCDRCGADLPKCANEKYFSYAGDIVLLTACAEMYEAEIIKANLESADIDVFILSQKDSSYPCLVNGSSIKIFVKKDDEENARDYLDTINHQSTTTGEEE